jgi:hypothetical protein
MVVTVALRTAASKAVGVPRDLFRRVDEFTHGPIYQLVADLVDLRPDDAVADANRLGLFAPMAWTGAVSW